MSKPERGDRAENDSLAEASEKLPLAVKLAFGFPAFPGIGMTVPIAVFMTKFYADSIGPLGREPRDGARPRPFCRSGNLKEETKWPKRSERARPSL